MRRLEKQQLCTWITLFSTFLGHRCTTMTRTFLISHFVEDGNTTQQCSFSSPELSYCPLQVNSTITIQHTLTNCTRWNKRKKVWGSPNSLFKWCFRSCCWCCCLNSLKEKLHFYTITFQEDKHLFFALCFCLLGWYIQFTIGLFDILTSQKEDVTELKFLWLVNTTDNSTKFILIFEDVTCII